METMTYDDYLILFENLRNGEEKKSLRDIADVFKGLGNSTPVPYLSQFQNRRYETVNDVPTSIRNALRKLNNIPEIPPTLSEIYHFDKYLDVIALCSLAEAEIVVLARNDQKFSFHGKELYSDGKKIKRRRKRFSISLPEHMRPYLDKPDGYEWVDIVIAGIESVKRNEAMKKQMAQEIQE